MASPLIEFFAPGGRLARAHDAYEDRAGQVAMALAVERVLGEGGRMMVEAGTGTGKTLAYLVPAVLSGRRVIVSTGTRNLQDQILDREIPFLRERLGLDVAACAMKGRDNYLCRLSMSQLEREPLLEDLGEQPWIERLARWSRTTRTGDRAEVAELPDRLKLWRDVNARAETCAGTSCPEFQECWLTRMKRAAEAAQIVVVNHHLFFADLALRSSYGAVLPAYDAIVFDEAHLVEDVATLYFGLRVSAGEVADLGREAERLAARTGGPAKGGGGAARLRLAAEAFFAPLRARLGPTAGGRTRFDPPSTGGPCLEDEWRELSAALEAVSREGGRAAASAPAGEALERRASELRATTERVLAREDPAFVYGIEQVGRDNVQLSAAPIDVSAALAQGLYSGLHACVLTSATLAVAGSFQFFQRRLGLEDAESIVVDSPFDHAQQAALYLPRGMPEPRHPRFIERMVQEIAALLEISEGRAFLLFTSYANMDAVGRALAASGRWPLLVQGEGSKVALVERFRRTPRAVLLGTTSFWHGVDVVGEALSLVVVDKLPFDVPSDPLVAARVERIRGQGGDAFREYQVPLAVLALKQGLGRLLRSRSDRGLLAVLDPRLTTRGYGRAFLASLPPYRRVHDLAQCAEFFGGCRGTPATA